MIYTDLETIYKTSGIENKYALAMVISARARQLSEQKGRFMEGEGSERYLTYALEEIRDGILKVSSYQPASTAAAAPEPLSDDAPVVAQ